MFRYLENGNLEFYRIVKCRACGKMFEEKSDLSNDFCSYYCNSEWFFEKHKQSEMDKKQKETKEKSPSKKEIELINSKVKRQKERKKRNKYKREYKIIRDDILKRDNYMCVECGAKNDLNIHHIVHRENGGNNNPENLQTLCAICHSNKHKNENVYKLMEKRITQRVRAV